MAGNNPFGTPASANDADELEFSVDFSDYSDTYAVDPGDYDAKVTDIVFGTSKSSGAPMYTVTFAMLDSGKEFKSFLSLTPTALFKIAEFCKALGIPVEGKVSLKKDEIVNKRVVLRMVTENYEGNDRSTVKKILPHPDGPIVKKGGKK